MSDLLATIVHMSDFDLPADLIQLQQDLDAARHAADDYVAAVEAELAALPAVSSDDGTGAVRPTWSDEQSAELNRLRAAYMTAAKAKWAHPGLGKGSKFEDALRDAARAEPATV
jgi:hypothetical protein